MERMISRIKEDSSYKGTLFFALVIAWSLGVQFFQKIHSDLYQYVVFLLPSILFLIVDKEIRNNIKKQFKRLPFKTILIIPLIWICFLPFKLVIVSIVTSFNIIYM